MKAHSFLAPSASLLGAIFPLLCTAQQQSTDHDQFTPATVPGVVAYFEKIDSDSREQAKQPPAERRLGCHSQLAQKQLALFSQR